MMRLDAYDICIEFTIFCDEIKQVRNFSGEMDHIA